MQSEVDIDIYFPVVNQDSKYKICTSVKTTFGKVKRTKYYTKIEDCVFDSDFSLYFCVSKVYL